MSGAAVCVDVQSVGIVVHHMRFRSQSVKYILSNGRGAAVGTIQGHLHIFKGTGRNGNQIANVAVSARRKIHRTADFILPCQRKLAQLTIQIPLNLHNNGLLQLLPLLINNLNTVIIIWVMAGRYHNTAAKALSAHHVGYAGSCCYVEQINIRARRRKTCHQ